MTRRSITLFPALETIIRAFQARMLTKLNRDVSFTEALNLYLIGAVVTGAGKHMENEFGDEPMKGLLDSTQLDVSALIDAMQDKVFQQALENSQREPTS
jgi:hypothetical protein